MPTSRLVFRIDLGLALAFVAVCTYARRVELRQLAPLASGPPIEKPITALPKAPAPTLPTAVAATNRKVDSVKLKRATKKSIAAGRPRVSIATTSSTAAPHVAIAPVTTVTRQAETRQSCGSAGSASPCRVAVANIVVPTGTAASADVVGSDEEVSSIDSFSPVAVGPLPITQLYTDMLETPVSRGNSPRGGEIDSAGRPTEPAVGSTPTYPRDVPIVTPFVGNPVPFYIMPASLWLSDVTTKDDGPKKFRDGGDSGEGGRYDRDYTGDNRWRDQPPVTATPEPATLTLLATGIAALGTMRRRRKATAASY